MAKKDLKHKKALMKAFKDGEELFLIEQDKRLNEMKRREKAAEALRKKTKQEFKKKMETHLPEMVKRAVAEGKNRLYITSDPTEAAAFSEMYDISLTKSEDVYKDSDYGTTSYINYDLLLSDILYIFNEKD